MSRAEKKEYQKRLQAAYQAFLKDPNKKLQLYAADHQVGYANLTTFITQQFKQTLSF